MSPKTIVVLATLDTKGVEAAFLREEIEARGLRTLLIDAGVVGRPQTRADIPNAAVAEAGGISLEMLQAHADREEAGPVMAAGASQIVRELVERDSAHAIVSLGGTQGTTLATTVMRALPYGFPKIMVSTMASSNVAPWVDTKDITMMHSVTDIMGLNPFMRRILANAAGAACGMAEVEFAVDAGEKPLVAITTVGITTKGAMLAAAILEQAGFETIVFHAVGTGGRAMEDMMRQGLIGAVLDYSTIEVSNEMHHALLAGGPDRLTTAGQLGLPQVICPGAVEVLVFNEPESVPAPYRDRKLVRHSPKITDVRLNREEMIEVAREIARRLQATTDEAVFLVPTAGYDCYAVPGGPFHNPEADAAFVDELQACLPGTVRVVQREFDINHPAFADEAAKSLIKLIQRQAQFAGVTR